MDKDTETMNKPSETTSNHIKNEKGMLAAVALEVFREPPGESRAKHSMFDLAIQWFRRSNDFFSQLSSPVLSELVTWCQHTSLPASTLIIKQGDRADSFYALLKGRASAWVVTSPVTGDEGQISQLSALTQNQQLTVIDKHKLGICVKNYVPGGTFGELALIIPNSVRNASVICDEDCELAVIAQDLYNRLLLNHQKKEFDERLEICQNHNMFSPFSRNHRQKIAMAMEKVNLEFDNVLIHQLQPASFLYFIMKGNAKIIVDPTMHEYHLNSLGSPFKSMLTMAIKHQMDNQKSRRINKGSIMTLSSANPIAQKDNSLTARLERYHTMVRAKTAIDLAAKRRHVVKPGVQEVCWVKEGELIGEPEAVLGLDNYLWSCIAAEPIVAYKLSMQNFRRIFNIYRSSDQVALIIEEECYRKMKQRFERIDTPLCHEILHHLKTNIDEAAQAAYEASRPKLPPPPAQRSWDESLAAFRKRLLQTNRRREKIWVPPKPCVDAKMVSNLYDEWQEDLKNAAMMSDGSGDLAKALSREERKLYILRQEHLKLDRQKTATLALVRKFNDSLAQQAEAEAAEGAAANNTTMSYIV